MDVTTPRTGQPNHLQGQTSPYLLQHLYNPVDWHPWGAEALARARREDKPIFLSIGYAACHWCHVMERESFEDPRIAAILNARFVPIKVDREERPDLDEIYMNAVQLLTGSGGWPLNVFLTPDGRPFYGGTYWPPDERYGRPGFASVLEQIGRVWETRREDVHRSAEQMTRHLRDIARAGIEGGDRETPVGRADAARAAAELAARFDPVWGGFGHAPKFPPSGSLSLLLREHHRTGEPVPLAMVRRTLEAMSRGGVYDQIGGGFARYSVDERWLVPHFEKMLYDQALLVPVYVDAWLVTREAADRRVVEQTLDFVRRELTDPAGGFHSSLDADSEGHEGRFYVWTPEEIDAALGPEDGALVRDIYGVTDEGNFEGRSIPTLLGGSLAGQAARRGMDETELAARLAPLHGRLLAARGRRPRPATDDKVLTAWNGLMITAFARAAQAFGRPEDLASATRAAEFLLAHAMHDGWPLVTWRAGQGQLDGFLDDHVFLARGLLDLYEASFDRRWLDAAARLARAAVERFEDREHGGFFFVSSRHEELLARTKSAHDGALPSGAGVAVETLLRLAWHLDEEGLRRPALAALRAMRPALERAPSAFASLLVAADQAEPDVVQIAIVGDAADPHTRALLATVRGRYLPRRVIASAPPGDAQAREGLPLLQDRGLVGGRPAAYVCRGFTCDAPVTDVDAFERLLPSR